MSDITTFEILFPTVTYAWEKELNELRIQIFNSIARYASLLKAGMDALAKLHYVYMFLHFQRDF